MSSPEEKKLIALVVQVKEWRDELVLNVRPLADITDDMQAEYERLRDWL